MSLTEAAIDVVGRWMVSVIFVFAKEDMSRNPEGVMRICYDLDI